jgi:hypothetical protein
MSTDPQLALTLVAALDDEALDLLADRLAPRLSDDGGRDARPIAYTVATLAHEVGLSQRAVRGAIERRELAAVKRSGRWLVSADAVAAWVAPAPAGAQVARRRRSSAVPHGSLASLAARIDRAESEPPSGKRRRPPVRLEPRQDKVTPATRQRPGVVGQRRSDLP